jgi:hypothetical protein
MFGVFRARGIIRNSIATVCLARSKKRESVTDIWLGSAVCGMVVVTRSMLVGEMPAFAASLITCRHRNFKKLWISSSYWLKNGERQSCAPKLCLGDAIAH